jgi:hypothetical protein
MLRLEEMRLRRSIRDQRPPADIPELADGSISPGRREGAEARVAESAEFQALLANEETAVELLRRLREEDRAPEDLRRRIAADQRRPAPSHRRISLGGGVLATAAVVAVVVVLTLSDGTPAGPSVAQAAGLALRGAVAGAPRADPRAPGYLTRKVGPVYFPDWSRSPGWTATGQRADRLDGHRAVTVYYRAAARTVAYTIVSLPGLPQPSGPGVRFGGLVLHRLRLDGRSVVTWRQGGATCVLSGGQIAVSRLERLAAWPA